MGKTTIEWTASVNPDGTTTPGYTFNPWIGCAKVSPGCANCYAETLMDKRMGRVQWGVNGTRVHTSDSNWKKPYQWNRKAQEEGVRKRIFCASLADVFEDRPELVPWRADLFAMIDATPNLDWLLLTKRPENIKRLWPFGWYEDKGGPFTWPNVWIGTSVENQEQADKRIPHLLSIPASVRFLSMEPLLGPVDLSPYLGYNTQQGETGYAERRDLTRPSSIGRMEDRRPGSNLDVEEGFLAASREETTSRLSSSSQNDQWGEASYGSAPTGMVSFQRPDTRRDHDQPQGRQEGQQPTGQPGTGNLFGEHEACLSDRFDEPGRSKESSRQTHRSTGASDSRGIRTGSGNPDDVGSEISGRLSDDFENSPRGSTANTSGTDGGLYGETSQGSSTRSSRPISQVIVGGESGAKARPMRVEWALDLLNQCRKAGVPFFMKQLGGYPNKQDDPEQWPVELRVREFPS
jgi:protein gp37